MGEVGVDQAIITDVKKEQSWWYFGTSQLGWEL
jgi:hypothetical protein